MTHTHSNDLARTLSERVERRVKGRGISRGLIESTVRQVVAALPASTVGSPSQPVASLVAAVSARSTPDLASRVRRLLDAEHVPIVDIGVGHAGQHTVVTLELSGQARSAVERLAEQPGYFVTFLDPADARST
ncbi:MAG: hypothetical protein H0W30_03055 [Gemmatimonadaceae bacterium]|jgi:hypothetical protein|nr:hypothetical protein [Gemmatimonadaceae bacterium]MDQ3520343.1 hypothetical protein [Gemmatimonadota bacterium]